MKLLLSRYNYDDKQTLGKMYLLDERGHIIGDWHSLELPYKDNKRRISCVPEGSYNAVRHNSPKFGSCFWIKGVPNRSEILIHKGNYHTDILGCVLIGSDLRDLNKDGYLDVISSNKSVLELLKLVKEDNITIEIKSI